MDLLMKTLLPSTAIRNSIDDGNDVRHECVEHVSFRYPRNHDEVGAYPRVQGNNNVQLNRTWPIQDGIPPNLGNIVPPGVSWINLKSLDNTEVIAALV